VLEEIDGIVFAGFPEGRGNPAQEEAMCRWCRDCKMPLLAIDNGLLSMNSAYGGLLHQDLSREMPDALHHRHPPEDGIRHSWPGKKIKRNRSCTEPRSRGGWQDGPRDGGFYCRKGEIRNSKIGFPDLPEVWRANHIP
jgi:hypothetical protein